MKSKKITKITWSDNEIQTNTNFNIIGHFGVKKDQITPSTNFVKDLGADPGDLDELCMKLQKEFHMKKPFTVAEKKSLTDVASIHTLVRRKTIF